MHDFGRSSQRQWYSVVQFKCGPWLRLVICSPAHPHRFFGVWKAEAEAVAEGSTRAPLMRPRSTYSMHPARAATPACSSIEAPGNTT